MSASNGILVVDKPSGPTSHDVVAQARRLFQTRAIGHAGTLDPMASGVLLLLVGEATKLSSSLTLERKSYVATVRFGMATDSDDALGTPVASAAIDPGWLSSERLEAALENERRRREQVPPRVSAIKQGGVTAYRRHRRGESVELPPRSVHVHALDLLERSDSQILVSLSVSKGYYVRSLARDLGEALRVPAHLATLRRTSSGCFRIEEATIWPCSTTPPLLTIADVAKRILPHRTLAEDGVRRARLGQALAPGDYGPLIGKPADSDVEAWMNASEALVALGRVSEDGVGRVVRGFGGAVANHPGGGDPQCDEIAMEQPKT